jgi:hypothetical protein
VVPLTDLPAASIRLVKDGEVIASQELEVAAAQLQMAAPSATPDLADALAQAEKPALVRYSTDGGVTWTTLGMDITADAMPALPEENAIYQVLTSGTWR